MHYILLIWPFISAVLNRMRGGMWGDKIRENIFPYWGTTVNRICTSALILLPSLFILYWYEYILFVLIYYICLIFGWSKWQYMDSGVFDIVPMSIRGLILTGPAGIYSGLYIFGLSGLLMGLCYYIPTKFRNDNSSSDVGEVLFGFVLGVALCLNILWPIIQIDF